MNKEQAAEGLAAATKSSLAVGIVGATVFGFTIQEFAAALGAVFILMQMAHFIYLRVREYLAHKAFQAAILAPAEKPKP